MRRVAVRVVSFLAALLSAPSSPAGTLTGTLCSPEGAALPAVVVVAAGAAGRHSAVTGPDGRFALEAPPGEYTLSVDVPGFVLSQPALVLGDGETRLTLTLAPAPVREHVIVSATRGEAALATLGVSGTVLDSPRVAEREATSFVELLREVPGVAVARTGSPGQQSSAFVRGGESRFARILVDGVPVNQPGGAYDFGSLQPLELEQVEVVRGAASSLYGTDALAGVIQLVTRRAAPDAAPGLHADAQGGSFAWWRGQLGTSGRTEALDWNLGLQRLTTDGAVPNGRFEQTAAAASLGARLGAATDLRLVLRADDGVAGTPGQTAYGRPDLDATFERADWVLGALLRRSGERVSSELRLGYARSDQLSLNPEDSGPYLPTDPVTGKTSQFGELFDAVDADGYQNDTSRLSAGYQGEAQAGARHLLSFGADLEHEAGSIGSRSAPLLEPTRTNAGAYVQDRVVLGGRAYLTLGGRVEHNDSYGTRAVPRAALAVRLRGGADATTLRASGGAGIKEPTFQESFGVSEAAQGNPDLRPERSRTFDLGLEQRLLDGRLRAEATLFHHDYYDQIAFSVLSFNPFRGSYVNLGQTRAQGLELALAAAPAARFHLDAQYTLTDGEVIVSGSDFDPVYAAGNSLLRRPRHQGSLTARYDDGRFGAGATLFLVGSRADSDFSGIGLTENDGYARVDARLRGRVVRGLEAYLAAENLLDAAYQEALGYPAPGRAVRFGIRYRTGAAR
jgi:outer membrane cobalamin receptor